jgi:hypothetical protein
MGITYSAAGSWPCSLWLSWQQNQSLPFRACLCQATLIEWMAGVGVLSWGAVYNVELRSGGRYTIQWSYYVLT